MLPSLHQVAHQNEAFVDHREERIGAQPPSISVSDLLEQIWFLVKGLVADLYIHREIGADIERRIDVDEFEAARILDLPAQRAALQR